MRIETREEERQRLANLAGEKLLFRVASYLEEGSCDEEDWPPPDLWLDEYYYNGWRMIINHLDNNF
jgi:hypothetical protein